MRACKGHQKQVQDCGIALVQTKSSRSAIIRKWKLAKDHITQHVCGHAGRGQLLGTHTSHGMVHLARTIPAAASLGMNHASSSACLRT